MFGSSSTGPIGSPGSIPSISIVPPPLVLLDGVRRSTLPSAMTSFVGRVAETGAIVDLLGQDGVRLVTLTGPGGVGKTRLAIHVAGVIRNASPDDVVFVPLAALTDPRLVFPTIAQALGIPDIDDRDASGRLATYLYDRTMLLVLDSVERVTGCGPDLMTLLAACPGVRLLVTGRGPLGVSGEHVFSVSPLQVRAGAGGGPGARHRPGVAAEPPFLPGAPVSDAVRLFIERVSAASPAIALTQDDLGAVTTICERLDGLPLAIELAAARATVLPVQALASRLGSRLPLLTGGPRDLPERQRTMRSAIAWSYDLLTPVERTVFRRLSVFVGGFSLAAAEAVAGQATPDPGEDLRDDLLVRSGRHGEADPLTVIQTLVQGSLLRYGERPAEDQRFTMLETIREFGLERLEAEGEADAAQAARADWVSSLVVEAVPGLAGPDQARWLDRLESDHDNVRATLAWCLDRDPAMGLRLAADVWPLWRLRFHAREGLDWLGRVLAATPLDPSSARANAILGAGTLAWVQGEPDRAATFLDQARSMFAGLGDGAGEGWTLHAQGRLAWDAGEIDLARERFGAALGMFRRTGVTDGAAMCLHSLGLAAYIAGDPAEATALLRQSLAGWEALGFRWGLTCCVPGHLGDIARSVGEYERAAGLYRQSLALNWEHRGLENISWIFIGLADTHAAAGRAQDAARLLGAATAARASIGSPLRQDERADFDAVAARVRVALGDDAFDAESRLGRELPLADAVASQLDAMGRGKVTPRTGPIAPARTVEHGSGMTGTGMSGQLQGDDRLTAREREVLRLVVAGRTDQQIADDLFISSRTVQSHLLRVFRKLKVRSRTGAAARAVRDGLV